MTEKENMRDRKRQSRERQGRERQGRRQDPSGLRRQKERAGSSAEPDRLRDREQDSIEDQPSPGGGIAVQAGMLAAATIVVRIIGLLYRAPLTAIIGDEGNGYYGAAYNIYMIILILSSNSLPAAISRQMAAKIAVREYKNAQRAFLRGAVFSDRRYGWKYGPVFRGGTSRTVECGPCPARFRADSLPVRYSGGSERVFSGKSVYVTDLCVPDS